MRPIASPPAAPPPSPPPPYGDVDQHHPHHHQSERENPSRDKDGWSSSPSSSYRSAGDHGIGGGIGIGGGRGFVPTITNYGLSPQHQYYGSGDGSNTNGSGSGLGKDHGHGKNGEPRRVDPRVGGDVTVRPNTGNTNQEAGAAFGSLREIASALRWMTVATTVTAIGWEGFAFPVRILSSALVDPSKVVLGAYLGVFCLLILGVEMNAPLRDSFGFLYNPMTRGSLLMMMSSMCLGILKTWWECLLGVAFVVVGLGYVYTYVRYPEYRRWQDYNENRPTSWRDFRQYWRRPERAGTAVWADPDDGRAGGGPSPGFYVPHLMTATSEEARSLLRHV